MMNNAPALPVLPWWRVRVLWLVIAGPAAVVAAGIAMAVLAFAGHDPMVAPRVAPAATADAPAQVARNHAATAGAPGLRR